MCRGSRASWSSRSRRLIAGRTDMGTRRRGWPRPRRATLAPTPLSKNLAQAGLASRRGAAAILAAGRIAVNGDVRREPGAQADPDIDRITLDGRPLQGAEARAYVLLHKPRAYVTSRADPQGRPVVIDLLPGAGPRVFPLGRLDYDAEGLLLITNDGELTNRLLHPRYEIPRVYEVEVERHVSPRELGRRRRGAVLPDGQAALQIGELKRQHDRPYFVPEREAQLIDRLLALNTGPLTADALRAVWREILSASLALENPLPVGYLGPAGTFTHAAAMRRFGTSAQLIPLRSIADIFEEVERGRAECGVVPVENSTEGPVNITLDRLIESDAVITGELTLDISQHLLSRATELEEIKIVCSHPQGLAQTRQWLLAHLPEVRLEEMSSTTAAAERAKDDPTVAAVASELAARTYDVPVLRRRIEDNPANSTRFLVIGRRAVGPTGRDKTSILFSMKNEPGVLYSILQPFAARRLNLTKIESRPTKRRPWEYVNFVDFEGHRDTDDVRAVLDEVKQRCQFLKILGSYPAA